MTTLPPGLGDAFYIRTPLVAGRFVGRKKQNLGDPRFCRKLGAGNETRTRDPDLGKVVLYQLSYSRGELRIMRIAETKSTGFLNGVGE